ncbi:hypothetical protein [Cytobacillus sp.]|uniref:hypothetical protein n=1 Tax=Cytobacillus sp. TaxID=2675269 RepID=UPI0028BD7D5E|nr:hypothetical protein [Cytobacillus sp.]
MDSKLYNDIFSIKKTKAKIKPILKSNKKFRSLFISYFSIAILYLAFLLYSSFFKYDNTFIVGIVSGIFILLLFIILKNPHINTIPKSTSIQRREELMKLLNLMDITESEEIKKLQGIVEHWANQVKPEKFNWAIILIFYSVIYTSIVSYFIKDIFDDFKFIYLFNLFILAVILHLLFIIVKSFIEMIFFSRADSTYNYFMWVNGELKKYELEVFLKQNKNKNKNKSK